jgi:hypothetical protein
LAATLIETNAPTRFSTAAISTATRGLSAPVAIEVATALAVSWKPLVKPKQMAVTTTRIRISMGRRLSCCSHLEVKKWVNSTVTRWC